jgi:hypothetical protein
MEHPAAFNALAALLAVELRTFFKGKGELAVLAICLKAWE